MEKLALHGGQKAIYSDARDIFTWPIVTKEDEEAILDVLYHRSMSGTDITMKFEDEFAAWQHRKYALAHNNGTSAIMAALYGLGVGVGDEVICPSANYWASVLQLYALGATPVFADIDLDTLCIKPSDIERVISPRTKAVVCVHNFGHPCDMDAIMPIAKKHGIKVLEDLSHSHGGFYKGKRVGNFGDVAAMSIMTGKAFACGEGGILVTDNREIYERAVALGHYERANNYETADLVPFEGLPLGGYKLRMHQMSSAMGRVQLKYFDKRIAEIQKALNHFWDLLEGVPGIRAHRVTEQGSTMGGWYAARGIYKPEELGGLSLFRFCEALRAEGFSMIIPGVYAPLHTHELLKSCDVYGQGKPTRIASASRDVRLLDSELKNSEIVNSLSFSVPPFKHDYSNVVEQYADAFKKVCGNYKELLKDDYKDKGYYGNWGQYKAK